MPYIPVTFVEGDTATINATAIVDGQILFDTEEQKLYMDSDGIRQSYGGGSDEAQVISYTDFMNLTPAQREEGKYLVTGMTPMTNAYNLDYKDGKTVGQELDTVNQHLTADNDMPFRFGFDSDSGKYGYITESGGADTFNPFSSFGENATLIETVNCNYPANQGTLNKTLDESGFYCIVTNSGNLDTSGSVSRGTPTLNGVALPAIASHSDYSNGASVYFFHADAGDVVYNYMSMWRPNSGYARTWLFKID